MSTKAENGWIVCLQWGVSNYTYWEEVTGKDARCNGLVQATKYGTKEEASAVAIAASKWVGKPACVLYMEEQRMYWDVSDDYSVSVVELDEYFKTHFGKQEKISQGPGSKYIKYITNYEGTESIYVDVYCVLSAYDVKCPAIGHAIKKLLMPGQRGSKTAKQDMEEAIVSIQRAITLMK